jgi:hypothetical protein
MTMRLSSRSVRQWTSSGISSALRGARLTMPVLTISGKYGTGENMRLKIQSSADKGEVLTGEQPVIIDRGLFDAVQARLNEQVNNHKATKTKSEAMLVGRIFDDRGNPMTPTHARKWLASSISS